MSSTPCEGLHCESPFSEHDRHCIRAHLEELLASRPFAGSRRRQAFLRYVVEETLAGQGSAIKEANIAVDVFGKTRDFEAQGGSLVRVTGGDVRKCLAQAYSSGLGQDLRIELPLGGYQPTFHFASRPAGPPESIPAATTIRTLSKRMPRRTWTWMAVAAGVLIATFATVRFLSAFLTPSPLDLLWRPFLDKDRPVLISITAPTLLKLNPLHQAKWLPLDGATSIPASELVVLKDSYVGTGGATGAARFAEQLTGRKQSFDLKFGSDVNFADLKNSPAILIGVSILTQQLTHDSRFQMQMVPEGIQIVDSKQKDRVWGLPRRNYASPPRAGGYSLITRLLHSDSGHPMLIIEGMDSHNTEAAVEFLTKNNFFQQFTKSVSPDWSSKNFQLVLHNAIYGNSPGTFSLVASEVW